MTDDLHVGEARLLRERIAALEDRILRRPSSRAPAAHRLVGKVFSQGAIPTGSGKFYACHPIVITGDEVEGGTPTLTADTSRAFLVDVLGGTAAAGDYLVCRRVDHRWVAKVGATTPTPPTPAGSVCVSVVGCNLKQLDGATITLSMRTVTSIAVVNGGSGYVTPPNVVVSNANGNGCVANAVVSGGVVTAINVTTGGAYSSTPGVTIVAAGAGSGATATATLGALTVLGTGTTTGQVATITRTAAGSGYTSQPAVAISGDGTGAAAVANISAPILSFSVAAAGSNYTTAPVATISTATGSGGSARVLLVGTTVASFAVTNPGSYTSGNTFPTATLTTPGGHTGSGATAATSVKATAIARIADGAGYAAGDLLTLVGGTAPAAAVLRVTAVDVNGGVSTASIQSAGSYTAFPADPTPVTGGGGSGATFAVTWQVLAVAVTAGGANYSTAPLVSLAGPGGATATASLTPASIASVTRVSGGAYSATPTVLLSGGGTGSGGVVTVTLDTFTVASFTLTNKGSGYTTATASVSGGGGSGATASVTVQKQACLDVPGAGNYTITATDALGRFNTGTSVVALTATPAQSRSITLTPVSATYICSACSTCAYPIKKSLHTTLPNGGGGGFTVATNTVASFNDNPYSLAVTCPGNVPGTVTVNYQIALAGGGFQCVNLVTPGYCNPPTTDCIPNRDGINNPANSPPCTINDGTFAITCPENGGVFLMINSTIFYQNIFSGTWTVSE